VLRLIDLGSRPFWLDEVFTMQRASMPPAALVHDSFLNHHMPSFFLMLSALVPLGDPQFWLRVPSAAFGALSVMLVYLIANRIAGRNAGLIAALILGLSPTALAFSQEARSYTMEMSLIMVALLGLARLAMDIPTASIPFHHPTAARATWATFILGSVAAVDVLGDGLLWVLTANLVAAVMVWQSPSRRPLIRNILLADAIIAALSLPFYLIMTMTQAQGFSQSVMWIPTLTAPRLWYNIGSIYLMRVADSVSFHLMDVPTPALLIWLIDAGLILAAAIGAWRLRRTPGPLAAIVLSFAVLPITLITISIWRPVLLPRYILWSAAPFAILAGIGAGFILNPLTRRTRIAAFAVTAALLMVNLLPYYGAETKPRWDIAAQLLARDVAPGDVVLLDDLGALPVLRMYLPPGASNIVLQDSAGDLKHAQLAQQQGKRIWAVYGHAGQSSEPGGLPEYYAEIAPLGRPTEIQIAGNRIYITLFDATSHSSAANCIQQAVLTLPESPATQAPTTLTNVPC
jgi:4-amino-4-deoxy-L-arabinose transferase-like glycosyltransferase